MSNDLARMVRMPSELYERARARAEQEEISIQQLIREGIALRLQQTKVSEVAESLYKPGAEPIERDGILKDIAKLEPSTLAASCTNADYHWKLRQGESCRYCKGVA
jgi:hypothetical protein